jgi:outer membrane protein assembly factor BamB
MHSLLLILLAAVAVPQEPATLDPNQQWGQWRGPLGTGVAPDGHPPTEWSEEAGLRWKVELPGRGHSSPVVWGERVYLTSAIPIGDPVEARPSRMHGAHDNPPVTRAQRYVVLAVDVGSGEVVWKTTVHEGLPSDTAHVSGSFASASPVTDGRRIYASFGSAGIYALDLEGQVLWSKDLGEMRVKHSHGEGAGLALFGDTLAINWDHEGDSFVLALDGATGEQRWRKARDEPTSWSTPIVVEHGGRPQLIVPGTGRLRAYDLGTGEVIWSCGGLSNNIVASPVAGEGMVFAGCSYDKQTMLAIKLEGAAGDLTVGSDNLAWVRRRQTPYVPSLLLLEGVLYNLQHYQPILVRADATTGDVGAGPLRIDGLGNLYASPVAADGRVYLVDMEGNTLVLAHGPFDQAPEALALNHLEDRFFASPAIAGGALLLRGERWLYCIAEDS